ncbi:MAG: hypothetical protein IMF08_08120 [Proteobacteria bacterium]|nr:hypothetical protein [Pseudomonadota bacterium]
MFVISENDHTEETIREELERLYVAVGYLNAGSGNMEIAMHLIGAAIVELESPAERGSSTRIRMVHSARKADDAHSAKESDSPE